MQKNPIKNIDRVLWQSFQGELSPEAQQQLEDWLQQSEENRQLYLVLQQQWQKRMPEPKLQNQETRYEKILQAGTRDDDAQTGSFNFKTFMKVAAGLAIIFLTAFGVWKISGNKPEQQMAEVQWVEKQNLPGQKSRIVLPDGSIVWLNAESTLNYPAMFSDTSRVLQLEGEAYFQVTKDSNRPFVVQSGKFETTAIGTEFNINAYPENESIAINLVEGKVKVAPASSEEGFILVPGEAASCSNNDLSMKKYTFETSDVEWKDGVLTFRRDNFDQVVRELKRWYGIEIIVEGTPPNNWQLNGRFENAYLTDVLESMQYNRTFNYQLNEKTLQIKFQSKK